MRSGEWTQGMALALASAVEAIELKEKEEGTSPLSILRRLRRFKLEPKPSQTLGEKTHSDEWELIFGPVEPNFFALTVRVSLICKDHSQHGHQWHLRLVFVVQPDETRLGHSTYIYDSRDEEPLKLSDVWSADN